MQLTPNVELWNTPGHTSQDISVLIRNVPCCGTVAVVGEHLLPLQQRPFVYRSPENGRLAPHALENKTRQIMDWGATSKLTL